MLRKLSQIYDIDFKSMDLLHRGENESYFLRSGIGDFVLKVYRQLRDLRVDIKTELGLLENLKLAGMNVVTVRTAGDGRAVVRLEDRDLVLQKFCPGFMLCAPVPQDYVHLGETLKKLHQLNTDQFRLSQLNYSSVIDGNWPHLERAPFIDKKSLESLRYYRQLTEENFKFAPEALIHFDLHWGNVIVQEQDFLLLDWEECGIGNRVLDLGTINAHLQRSADGERNLAALLEGYGGGFRAEEVNLATMVKFFHLLGHIPQKLEMPQLKDPKSILLRYLGYFEKLSQGL